jgi:SpoVK/Ycf46/Vps4 family AAA+-type ATPase
MCKGIILCFNIYLTGLESSNLGSYAKSLDDSKYLIRPDFSFDNVGGYDEIKSKLKKLANLLTNNELNNNIVINLLFHGPKGTGKSSLVAAFAHECDAGLILFDDPGFYDCIAWGRPSWKEAIQRAFVIAKRNKPTIILFEKFDVLLKGRPKIRHKILDEMREKHYGLVVIAETNKLNLLDDELLSEFTNKIHVTMPKWEERREIINVHLKHYALHIDDRENMIDYLADETEEFTGSEIENTLQKALIDLIEEEYKSNTPNDRLILKRNHLDWALDNVWASKISP